MIAKDRKTLSVQELTEELEKDLFDQKRKNQVLEEISFAEGRFICEGLHPVVERCVQV